MLDGKPHRFAFADEWTPDILSLQLQMLVQLQCRALARRQALATVAQDLARSIRPSNNFDADMAFGRKTILIADDQSVCRSIAREILAKLDFQVLSSGADPRRWPVHERIDLMLLDVPFWSVTQSQRVRQARRLSTRLIVATPLPTGNALDALRAAGADALVRKPYQPLELRRCVGDVLRLTNR